MTRQKKKIERFKMHNLYNEIFASGFQYKTDDTNKSIRSYKLTLDDDKLKKGLFFRDDKEVRNVYHQLNSIYCWDTINKKLLNQIRVGLMII